MFKKIACNDDNTRKCKVKLNIFWIFRLSIASYYSPCLCCRHIISLWNIYLCQPIIFREIYKPRNTFIVSNWIFLPLYDICQGKLLSCLEEYLPSIHLASINKLIYSLIWNPVYAYLKKKVVWIVFFLS